MFRRQPAAPLLTEDERLEYQEIGEFARHDDTIHIGISSIALPVLFTAVGYAFLNRALAAPLASGSIVLWLYWWVVRNRRTGFSDLRYRRARELERKAGLRHHSAIHEADEQQGRVQRMARIKPIEDLTSVALLLTWVGLILASRF